MKHIHRLFLLGALFCTLAYTPAAKAQKVTIDNYQRLQVEFTTAPLTVAEVSLDGHQYNTLALDGYMASSEVGQPCLPTYSVLIEVPFCAGYEVTVSDAVYDTLDATALGLRHPLLPLQPSRSKSDTLRHAAVIGSAYGTDAYYGAATALVEPVGVARDRNLARLQFSPVSYNPVSGSVIVCRQATVDVRYLAADREGTLAHFNRYHSPAYASAPVLNSLYPKAVRNAAPVRYLIVANSMFRGQLDSFVQWKRRKGFLVDVAYTDSAAVGTTTTSIQSFIRGQYTGATAEKPAPTYLLLVGDHEQLPAFTGTTDNDHITDLYYTTWTSGDNIPDCYHGRFSAQNVSQLTPQVLKTLMYEQYTFADPSFLDRAVMVAGVDRGNDGDYGYTHADPAMDYAIQHYINGDRGFSEVRYFKNNTSVVPTGSNVYVAGNSSSMSATVRSYYNAGAGWINYSAHGGATSWSTPELTTTQVSSMTNIQKFGIMIGNCCLTNKFETTTCLGESLLRKDNYCGAVGYIGGSNSTYWYEDFYWAVGLRSSISASMSLAYNASNLGAYDRLCHTHGEAQSQWVATQGELMYQGNMAVESSTSSRKLYYWEIYHLMGDPSLMPYLTQASPATVNASAVINLGTDSYTVNTVPYAYVALTDATTHTLVAAAYANATGEAILSLPTSLMPGTYELAVSAQQYRTTFFSVTAMVPDGAYVSQLVPASLEAGATVPLTLTVVNPGSTATNGIVLHLASNNAALTLSADSLVINSLPGGDTLLADSLVYATVDAATPDGTTATITVTTTWDGGEQPIVTTFPLMLQAPVLNVSITGNFNLPPATTGTVSVTLANQGHADFPASHLCLASPTLLLDVTAADSSDILLTAGSTVTRTFTLQVDSLMPQYATIPLRLRLTTDTDLYDTVLNLFTGEAFVETFEGSVYHLDGWSQGSYPWTFDTDSVHSGSVSMRSTGDLTHNQTAEMTLTRTFETADSISFYYKVSSESNYDKFHFYIDDNDMLTRSGEVDWTRASYAVSAGSHTFKFTYAKDRSVSRGSDCAWIDDVTFPAPVHDIVLRRDTVCVGSEYVLFGDTIDTHEPCTGVRQGSVDGVTTVVDYLVLGPVAVTINVDVPDNSYQWNDSVYTASGEYVQVFTTSYGCDSTVTLVLSLEVVGIDGVSTPRTDLQVYPNPTTGAVSLSREADLVTVYDATGRQVAQQRHVQQLDLGRLPRGLYLLRATTAEGTATLRVILQ